MVDKRLRHNVVARPSRPQPSENYRKGKEVQLADKTVFNYSATDKHGVRSNKIALVASILIDGGISYIVFKGLNALFNQKPEQNKDEKLSAGYYNAVRDMENQRNDIPDKLSRNYKQNSGPRR